MASNLDEQGLKKDSNAKYPPEIGCWALLFYFKGTPSLNFFKITFCRQLTYFNSCCMYLQRLLISADNFTFLGLTGGKTFMKNSRWRPLEIKEKYLAEQTEHVTKTNGFSVYVYGHRQDKDKDMDMETDTDNFQKRQ